MCRNGRWGGQEEGQGKGGTLISYDQELSCATGGSVGKQRMGVNNQFKSIHFVSGKKMHMCYLPCDLNINLGLQLVLSIW